MKDLTRRGFFGAGVAAMIAPLPAMQLPELVYDFRSMVVSCGSKEVTAMEMYENHLHSREEIYSFLGY